LAHFNATKALMEAWTIEQLLSSLFQGATGAKDEKRALDVLAEVEKQALRKNHSWYDLTKILSYRSNMLSFWLGEKKYEKVVKQADADLQQFDAIVADDIKKGNLKFNNSDEEDTFFRLTVPAAKVSHLNWKVRAGSELNSRDGALNEILAIVKAMEADSSHPDSDQYGWQKYDKLSGAYGTLAGLADYLKEKDRADEFKKLCAENRKKSDECMARIRAKNNPPRK
jgi:hypothetical protein